MNSSLYPGAGIGIAYNADLEMNEQILAELAENQLAPFDYIEVQPSHPILFPKLKGLYQKVPVLMHCSQFSLGTPGDEFDREFLKVTKNMARQTGSPWFAEHISLTKFAGGDTRHFFLPYTDRALAEVIIGNARKLQEAVGIPLLLENAPRTFSLPIGDMGELDFIRRIVGETECGFLLDISSAVVTARWLKYDLKDYINGLPLDRLIEVHVGDLIEEWEVLEHVLRSSPIKAVTLEANISNLSRSEQAAIIARIRPFLGAPVRRWSGVAQGSAQAASAGSSPIENIEVKIGSMVQVTTDDLGITLDDFENGTRRQLSPEALPTLARCLTWCRLTQLFDGPPEQYAAVLGLVRPLIDAGLLKVRDPNRMAPASIPDDLWNDWGPARLFHAASRTRRSDQYPTRKEEAERLLGLAQNAPSPPSFKEYSVHPYRDLPMVVPQENGGDFTSVLLDRRTCREFSPAPMTQSELSALLFYTWGCTGTRLNPCGEPLLMKTSPSGGSLHCVEAYPLILNVAGVPNGIYHYSVQNHRLELLSQEDPREWLAAACGDQGWVRDAAVVCVMTGMIGRMSWKYRVPRAYRVMLYDIGHLGQTFSLVAASLGLGAFVNGGIRDEIFEEKLDLDSEEEPVFFITGAGYAKPGVAVDGHDTPMNLRAEAAGPTE